MKTNLLAAVARAALMLAVAAPVQAQQQQGDVLGQLLGSIFGNNQQASEQALESDWNQGRRPFEQRRGQLEARIDTAVRDGSLSRGEANAMRREYEDIVDLEARYAADGNVSQQQQQDLRSRYRSLARQVRGQAAGGDSQGNGPGAGQGGDRDDRRWQPLTTRNAAFEQRVTTALRNRRLTQAEATRLRADWRTLGQTEAAYRLGGIDNREQADLWARYDVIDGRLGGGAGSSAGGFDRDPARWGRMEAQLVTAERNGRISRTDAVQMRAQLSDLARLDSAYATGGYNPDQRAYLTRRYGELDNMLDGRRR